MGEIDLVVVEALPVGSVVTTVWGNQFRRFEDGWSLRLEGPVWDRRTLYSSELLCREFVLREFQTPVPGSV